MDNMDAVLPAEGHNKTATFFSQSNTTGFNEAHSHNFGNYFQHTQKNTALKPMIKLP